MDAEAALRGANGKFRLRSGVVERLAAARGVALRDLSFAELDVLWDQAKAELAASAGAADHAAGDGAAQEAGPASTGGEGPP